MARALELAQIAAEKGEVPVGALVVVRGEIIAHAHNEMRTTHDPTAHAEILALRRASAALGALRLEHASLYVSLEPCAMCAGAIALARIGRLYYAAHDPKSGGVEHGARVFTHPQCHHKPEIYAGIMEQQAQAQLAAFFTQLRHGQAGA